MSSIALALRNCNLVLKDCCHFYKVSQNFPILVETQMSYIQEFHVIYYRKNANFYSKHFSEDISSHIFILVLFNKGTCLNKEKRRNDKF